MSGPVCLGCVYLATLSRLPAKHFTQPIQSNFMTTQSTAAPSLSNPVVAHPMADFQRKVCSLVETKSVQPSDSLWKIAFIFGDKWPHWKSELEAFDFSTRDAIGDLLAVECWEEDEEA